MKVPSKKFKVGNLSFDLSGGRMVMLMVSLFILAMVVLIYFTMLRPKAGLDGARVTAPPAMANATVGGAGTPQYNAAVEKQNKLELSQAAHSGNSAISTPVDLSEKKVNLNLLDLNDQPAKPKAAASAPKAAAAKPAAPNTPPPFNPAANAAQALMLKVPDVTDKGVEAEMAGAIQRVSMLEQGGTTQVLTPYTPSNLVIAQAQEAASGSLSSVPGTPSAASSSPQSSGSNALIKRLLKPGNILYAEFTTRLKSTIPSPVVAQIEQGPLAGYKIIGSWSKSPNVDAMTIQFSRLVLPDGSTVGFQAFAVDPNTTLPAVASNVNYKVLSRTANFLGATFLAVLNGYSQAYATAGQQVIQSTTGTVVTTPPFSAQQARALGLEQATNALQPLETLMMQKVMQPDVINVDPGTPFGLLVISN